MADLARIKRNVAKMVGMSAPEEDIDAYIAQEGVSVDDVKNFKPPAAPPQSIGDQLSAGFTSGVNSIPIAGPTVLGGLEKLKAMVQGRSPEEVAASDKAQVEQNPVASTVGSVTGTTLPFLLAPELPLIGSIAGRALGMTGGLASRIGLGLASGAGINAADTAARGGDAQDIVTSAGIGGLGGAALPILGKGVGTAFDRMMGRSVPKDVKILSRALNDDGVAPHEINQKLQELGPEAMVMDLGPNLQRQAGAVASVPGPGQKIVRDAVTSRAKNAGTRIETDVAKTFGTGPEVGQLREQVIAAQQKAADPLYKAVRDVPVPDGGTIAAIRATPLGKKAFETAREAVQNNMAGEGQTYPKRVGPMSGGDNLTVELLDQAKQALDDTASEAARLGKDNLARQARNMARLLASEGDKVAPGYKAARDAFAGPAKVIEAMDAGEGVFSKSMTPGQLKNTLSTMSAGELDAFLQAARSSVEDKLGNAAVSDAAALRTMFKRGSYNETKLRLLFGDQSADDILKAVEREARFGGTGNVVSGNSETAARQAAQAEVAPELRRAWRPEGPVGIILSAIDAARSKLSGVTQPKINGNLGKLHTSGNVTPRQVQQLTRAARPLPRALIGPASAGLLAQKPGPLQITVHGGR